MSYATDVYARLGSELELYDSLLSAASTPDEHGHDAHSIPSAKASDPQTSSAVYEETNEDPMRPIQEIASSIRPTDASATLPTRKMLLSHLEKLDSAFLALDNAGHPKSEELKIIALSRLVVATYAVTMETLLGDAGKLEEETWYWTEIEESTRKLLAYLIQTLPTRFVKVTRNVVELAADTATHTLRNTLDPRADAKLSTTGQGDKSSTLAPKSSSIDRATLRTAFRSVLDTPNPVTSMLFPYTFRMERNITLDSVQNDSNARQQSFAALRRTLDAKSLNGEQLSTSSKKKRAQALRSTVLSLTPTYLVRHEAKCKRRGLINERDRLAQRLGRLALRLETLADDVRDLSTSSTSTSRDPGQVILSHLNTKLKLLEESFVEDSNDVEDGPDVSNESKDFRIDMDASLTADATLGTLRLLLQERFSQQQDRTRLALSAEMFGQPSALVQRWPQLVLYPFGLLLLARYLSHNWNGIKAKLKEARDTVQSFLIGWVWEPCVGLLDTIRHGNEGSVIMSRESLASDLRSLERMVADFTADKYGTSGADLEAVAARIREGDLTQVLKVYEKEMKSPVKSMVSGSLIRALLIQIQKAKVDLEVAMSGIDKLLKSQQLLFGAVGIAPALVILYIGQRYVRTKLFQLSTSRSESTGRGYQMRAWEAMRRVDRLLSPRPSSADRPTGASQQEAANEKTSGRDALTQGLLLLDLSTLRSSSGPLLLSLSQGRKATARRLHRQFLQDIWDVESGHHSAVERMWRSWGSSVLRIPS